MKFYGQFDPPVDKLLYEHYFQNYTRPGFFIECGAFDGITECSCKFFEETLNWTGINIEPSPPIFRQLEINRPESKNLNIALSNSKGSALFHQVIHPEYGELCSNSSLCHTSSHHQWLVDIGCTFKDYQVQTITWTDLIKNFRIPSVDLFVLDVEGAEREVIQGMKKSRVLPRIFCIEHGHCNYPNELQDLLHPFGYRYDFSSDVNSFFVQSNTLTKYVHYIKSHIEYFAK
jgi:FkbM family methyltransferase